ncbi:MAG: ATP-binding protein [Candidatus Omnitrophota bacterium]
MKFTISKKTGLLFVVMIAVLAITISVYFMAYHKQTLLREFDERAKILLSSVVLSTEYPVLIEDKNTLERIGQGILKQKDVVYCGIQDAAGNVLFQGGSKGEEQMRQYSAPILTEKFSSEGNESWIFNTSERDFEEIGYVYMILSLDSVVDKLRALGGQIGFFILMGIGAAIIVISLLLRVVLGKPIRNLIAGIEKISEGNFDYKVSAKSSDEIGTLAKTFNKMTEELQATTVSRDYIDNILSNMGDSLIVTDMRGIITMVNQSSLELLGYSQEELVGQPISQIFDDSQTEMINAVITQEEMYNYETYYKSKAGEKIAMLFSSAIIKDRKQQNESIVCTARDITDRKHAEESLRRYTRQIEQINKDLDNFTHIISHDLKEPLRSLYAFSKFVVDDYKDKLDAQGQEYMKRIMVNAGRMQKIIEDLLELTKVEKETAAFTEVDIAALLEEVKLRFARITRQSNARITAQHPLPVIMGDKNKISRLFYNLILNAINFSDKAVPQVEIGSRKNGSFYEFYVKDNGPGIEEKYFEKIFIIFQRLGKRDDDEGTGVGLAMAKKIVETHHGKIWVRSKLGEGSTFYFTLPVDQESIEEKKRLGEILVDKKLVTKKDIQQALEEQENDEEAGQ